MTEREEQPLVSIGLPVFNGEPHLTEAIQSILNQTYRNFELIIYDNDSSDRTAEICGDFAARDARIRYFRNETNLGAARNFNLTVERASGEYFKWAAADDRIEPEFLAMSVKALQRDPSAVLCQSQVKVIDEYGDEITKFQYPEGHASSTVPSRRFRDALSQDRWDFEVFGLIRTSALRRTRLLGNYIASDRILRAELALLGSYCILHDWFFFSRDHPRRSVRAYPAHHLRAAWFDPRLANRKVFPHWRVLYEYARVLNCAALSNLQRVCCYGQLISWLTRDLNWARLGADILIVILPQSWRLLARIAYGSGDWLRRT
jgi:glycosyltransferase involved in cell wall biosynthesis